MAALDEGQQKRSSLTGVSDLQENLLLARERIAAASRRANRDPQQIALQAVTKTLPVDRVREAAALGLRDFGENRVQELVTKRQALPDEYRLHMIGHLQRNKVRPALETASSLQSVDSRKLWDAVAGVLFERTEPFSVWIQVNTSGEQSKYGLQSLDEVLSLADAVTAHGSAHLAGLMTMAPFTDDPDPIRRCFALTREWRDAVERRLGPGSCPGLSMGMSNDFEIAVEEGSTLVRLGTVLFGARA